MKKTATILLATAVLATGLLFVAVSGSGAPREAHGAAGTGALAATPTSTPTPTPTPIGPWTLARLDSDKASNECLVKALQLAYTIALSQEGRAAYAKVNQAGADIAAELSYGNGPELKNVNMTHYGLYEGDSGGLEDQIKIPNWLWDTCGPGATDEQKKNTILIMAVVVLHETAHWKDDVKKHPKVGGVEPSPHDTAGEEGNQLEKDLFGGVITDGGGIKRGGTAVPDATRDGWLDGANWPTPTPTPTPTATLTPTPTPPPVTTLGVMISLTKSVFEPGEEIPVEVTYTNVSSSPIEVMNRVVLEGWPLHFDIVNQATGDRVSFLGPEIKLPLEDGDFITLAASESAVQTVNLLRDPISAAPRYEVLGFVTYELTAVHESLWGVEESNSNTLTLTVGTVGRGGIAEAVGESPDAPTSAVGASSPSSRPYAAIAGVAAAAALALTAGAWYVRRRWLP